MKKKWDVIVVGAGPAGSAAAITLAGKGIEVLLLDKARFPRDKVCGDGIVTASLEIIRELGIRQNGFYPIHGVKIISPKKYTWQVQIRSREPNQDTCIVPRLVFDHLLLQKAVACGCRFTQGRVQDLLFDSKCICGIQAMVSGESIKLHCKALIAADGVHSVIARRLRRDRHNDRHRLIAMRGYLEEFTIQPHQAEVYLLKEIVPGYLWIFPTGKNSVNIGLGMRLDRYKRRSINLRRALQNFLALPETRKRYTADISLKNFQFWSLHLASQKGIRRSYDGALLVGDAGAWIDPLTGGGICNAMITGRLAAETLYTALMRNNVSQNFLQRYEKEAGKRLGYEIKRSYYLQTFLANFPQIIDPLVKWAGKSDILAAIANKMYHDLQIGNIDANTQII
jgi:geranylgeranyl reductase family protein